LSELVYSRLSESAIADVVRKNVIGFTTNVIAVEMSSGPEYAKLELFAIEFVPSNRDFLCVSYVEQASTNQSYSFASSYAPPLGVSATEIDRLRLLCLNHISSVDKQGRSCGELEWGHTSKISWKVLKAINQYRELSSGTSGQVSSACSKL
jgi:hypothetical protein